MTKLFVRYIGSLNGKKNRKGQLVNEELSKHRGGSCLYRDKDR